jgi:manganese-dependent inorganic pyrophosphatase
MEKVYVIGHKSPDLDSVAAAISYANFKNQLENTKKYIPRVAGDINNETKYLLDKFGFDVPEKLESAKGKKFILVDHNESAQSIDGMEEAEIVEVLDHHKVDFKYSEPIMFKVFPWGASASIIAHCYFMKEIEIDKKLAGLMLGAILVDTVITKSPTCIEKDKEIIEKLAKLAEIEDWKGYGMTIFKVRSTVSSLSVEEIIKSDFKDFEFKAGKFGVGQVETVDLGEFEKMYDELLDGLEKIKKTNNYHSVILFVTDIINEGSQFLVSTDDKDGVEKALGAELSEGMVYLKGVMSRKKQVAPKFTEIFDK